MNRLPEPSRLTVPSTVDQVMAEGLSSGWFDGYEPHYDMEYAALADGVARTLDGRILHPHTVALAAIEWNNECFVCDSFASFGRVVHADDCAWLEARRNSSTHS